MTRQGHSGHGLSTKTGVSAQAINSSNWIEYPTKHKGSPPDKAITRDMGQCMGYQQRHGSMHGLSTETWVNAWAVSRNMGQCMGYQQRHGSMHGLSTETWVNAWAINRDMGQCMGYQQRHGSMHGLSAETWVNAWAITRHGSMHGLSPEAWVNATIGGSCHKCNFLSREKFLFCRDKHICFATIRHNQHAFVTTNTCLSQQK